MCQREGLFTGQGSWCSDAHMLLRTVFQAGQAGKVDQMRFQR